MLHNKLNYDSIYQILDDAHQSEVPLKNGWYKNTLQDKFPFLETIKIKKDGLTIFFYCNLSGLKLKIRCLRCLKKEI